MLPSAEEADNMDQAVVAQVFNLFGKGITQMLHKSVSQQTLIDELRAQVRSLQTQVSNLTASIDEIEDRIFIRLQNMQPTIYTREGIPIDDALDTITSKVQLMNEKIMMNTEDLTKFDAEISTKVPRDEFQQVSSETERTSETVTDIAATIQTLQKDMQKQRQENNETSDRILQTIRLQLEQNNIKSQMEEESSEKPKYVTKDELDEAIARLKSVSSTGNEVDDSAIVEYALGGDGPSEERITSAFEILQKRQSDLDSHYMLNKERLNTEYQRLLKIAEGHGGTATMDQEYEEEIEEEEEEEAEVEFRDVSVDNEGLVEEEKVYMKQPAHATGRRSVGLATVENVEEEVTVEEIEEEVVKEKKSAKKSGMKSVIAKMKENISAPVQVASAPYVRMDESRIVQSVYEAVMPKVEHLFVETLVSGKGSGIRLEKAEARQLVEQLSLLDTIKTELKNMKVKLSLKMDKGKAEQELQIRVTKDELFSYLRELFPENGLIEKYSYSKSKLPSLSNRNTRHAEPVVAQSTDEIRMLSKPKHKGFTNLVPARNSKLLSLNQKFLRGADGRYYLRDLGSEASSNQGSIERQSRDVSAAFDFQPFTSASPSISTVDKEPPGEHIREQTPVEPKGM